MASTVYAYEFDPYGTNANNKITGERHTITAANGTDLNFFIPKLAPFHRRGFVLTNVATGQPMRPGYDYYFGYRFDQMLLSGGMQPIYGAIVFNDRTFGGEVSIDYQTLGGEFTLDTNTILTLLANKQLDPRTTVWSAVVDVPADLPPVAHRHAVDDMTGMSEVVARIYDLIDATGAGFNKSMQALLEHIADHNNPHHITLADLGLDDLGNLVAATKEQAEGGTDNVNYMTSLRVMQSITANAVPLINAHASRGDNPHNVTKAQVGLGSVENYLVATNTEAQAGVATNRYMTPATTKAAIDTLAPLALASHTGDKNNPHQVTAQQVGLGSVQNYALATVSEAIAGLSNAKYMTPYLVAQAISNGSGQGLAAHLSDFNNPHGVTKAQVGLGLVDNYATATNAQTIAMTADNLFITPANLKAFLDGPVADRLSQAGGGATKDSVGLGKVENYAPAADGDVIDESSTAYSTPASTATQIEQLVVTSPMYTANSAGLNALKQRPPFESVTDVSTVMTGVWKGNRDGIQTTLVPNGKEVIYTELDYNLGTGTPQQSFTFTGKFTWNGQAVTYAFPLFLFSNPADATDTDYYAIAITKTALTQLRLNTDGTYTTVSTSAAIPAASQPVDGTVINYTVALTRNGNVSLTLKDGSGATLVTLATTVTALVGLFGVNASDLTYIFGLMVEGNSTANSTQVFVPANYPNLHATIHDVTAGQVATYANGNWTSASEGGSPTFRTARYYYNSLMEELLFAVTADKVVPLYSPTMGIVDSTDVTATAVPGGVQLFVHDGTIADA